jgi:hypothetical protein
LNRIALEDNVAQNTDARTKHDMIYRKGKEKEKEKEKEKKASTMSLHHPNHLQHFHQSGLPFCIGFAINIFAMRFYGLNANK